ncbi:MAG: DivIVA domain-containing protein [Lachnospiraceae bacterium]|nr:DivIVA domain-containing protein [Lachnospiraceae bacterium]
MSSKIEQIIEEMEDFIDDCNYQKFSSTNIIVERERLEEYLRELKTRTPDEIKRYQKIISNKEAILNDARQKADAMLKEAQLNRDQMASEHEVLQRAHAQADEVLRVANEQAQQTVDQAMMEANGIRESAMKYLDDMLAELQGILHHSIDTAEAKYTSLITSLRQFATVVDKDRAQLYPQVELEQDIATIEGGTGQAAPIIPPIQQGNIPAGGAAVKAASKSK